MTIEVCPRCRGSGIDTRNGPTALCATCKGSGYPPGYTPPTREEVLKVFRGAQE